MLDDAQVMDEIAPGHPAWNDVLYHGTKMRYCSNIAQVGLTPGGTRGSNWRAHIHLVAQVDTHGEREGVRGGSDALVRVDARRAYGHGARFFLSRTQRGAVLTEGIYEHGQSSGLPPDFLIDMINRATREVIVPRPTAEVNTHGAPLGYGQPSVQGEIIATQAEADRICNEVEFALGEFDGSSSSGSERGFAG